MPPGKSKCSHCFDDGGRVAWKGIESVKWLCTLAGTCKAVEVKLGGGGRGDANILWGPG